MRKQKTQKEQKTPITVRTLVEDPGAIAKFTGGNIKLGNMISFSKLMGDCDTAITLPSGEIINGTCGGHCVGCKNDCYVKKSYRYTSVISCHTRNTRAFRNDLKEAFASLDLQLSRKRKMPNFCRINQSGELESVEEFVHWCKLAEKYPSINFYVYTKATEFVETQLLEGTVPGNLIVLYSIWHEYGIEAFKRVKHVENVKAFVYVDGFDYAAYGINATSFCMAYDSNGKLNKNITCDKCQKCARAAVGGQIIGCVAHK